MATARKAPKARTTAPKAATKAEVPAKTSFWTRVKRVAARPLKAIARIVKRPFKSTSRTAIKREVSAARAFASRKARAGAATATTFVSAFWRRALQPFLAAVGLCGAVTVLAVSAFVTPIVTAAGLAVGGLLVLALSVGVRRLEIAEQASPAARAVLRGFEVLARVLEGAAYLAAAAVTIVLCAASWQFGVFAATFLALAHAEIPGAGYIALFVFDVLMGQWVFAAVWLALYAFRTNAREVAREIVDVPETSEIRVRNDAHGDFLRAKGTEELWGTEHDRDPRLVLHDDADEGRPIDSWAATWRNPEACEACGTTEGASRVKTQDARFMSGTHVPVPDDVASTYATDKMLCPRCYALECEENALLFTDVSLKARRVEVRLNETGIKRSAEYAASKFDATTLHWLETGWWRDRDGVEHPREWGCLHDGHVVATVVHDYRRKVYRATVMNKLVKNGVKTGLVAAKRAATDELNDEGHATSRLEKLLGEVADATGDAVAATGKA